jgi:hypothetical protein
MLTATACLQHLHSHTVLLLLRVLCCAVLLLQLRLATLQEAGARLAATETQLLSECCDGLLQTVAQFTAQFTAGALTSGSSSNSGGSTDTNGGASPRDDTTPLDTARYSTAICTSTNCLLHCEQPLRLYGVLRYKTQ